MLTRLIDRVLIAVLLVPFAVASAAGQRKPANPSLRPYVGDWVGEGWGTEVRFRQSQKDFVQQFPGAHSLPAGPGESVDGPARRVTVTGSGSPRSLAVAAALRRHVRPRTLSMAG